ncbi:ankyrin repeat domain-containing protein [Demequina lignilytica]|uniref:Ankyrin repeat domain-containing protein n=1 Tax=Demequina lignilytica TaxID=3051663 RepID=A0AB35MJK3_9MICO|nr:ankyrin repeat domain-containing protein [Demequina sp. SYSU T0a273]MDN4483858.1 ankyrin repeat domain-containing protein [Demequina sp. SYSU T0a273]
MNARIGWAASAVAVLLVVAGCTGEDAPGGASPDASTGEIAPALAPDIALKAAVVRGDLDAVRAALDGGADVLAAPGGSTALHVAARTGQAEAVALLLEAGADVGAREPDGDTPLHLAAYADDGEVIALLVEAGADPDAAEGFPYDARPIHIAASTGNLAGLDVLVANGADPVLDNGMDKDTTDYAACHGRTDVLRLLMDLGIAPSVGSAACARDALYFETLDYLRSLS